jgi:hypothetical protein
MNDYTMLLNRVKGAEQEAADGRAALQAQRLEDPTGRVPALTSFARECLTIARFAVANLPPETIRGWPVEALRRMILGLKDLPDYDVNDRDMALDLLNFADDCAQHELRRRGAPPPTKLTQAEIDAERARLTNDPIGALVLGLMANRA